MSGSVTSLVWDEVYVLPVVHLSGFDLCTCVGCGFMRS